MKLCGCKLGQALEQSKQVRVIARLQVAKDTLQANSLFNARS